MMRLLRRCEISRLYKRLFFLFHCHCVPILLRSFLTPWPAFSLQTDASRKISPEEIPYYTFVFLLLDV